MRRPSARSLYLPTLCLAALLGCRERQETTPAVSMAPQRIENPELQLAIAGLPGGYDLAVNEGDRLELVREPGLPPGRAWFVLGEPVEGGINLVEIIGGQRQVFEALPGGSFNGNGELVLPDGRPAYYSRGRFQDEGGAMVEEFRIWSVHPVANDRLLTVYYRYPAARDSAQRLEDVLLLVGEIEGLGGATTAATEGAGGTEASDGRPAEAAGVEGGGAVAP